MSVSLINLHRWRCANHAGIKSLRIVLPEDVLSSPEALAVPNLEGDIQVKPGKEIYTIEFDPATASFSEQLNATNRNGDFYSRELKFTVRRMRVSVSDFRRRLLNRRVHLLFTDNNEQTYYYAFMRLRESQATSGQRGGRNETVFTFRGGSESLAPYLNGSLVDDPGGVNNDIVIRDIVTGQPYTLLVGSCGELITVPITTDDPGSDIVIGNWTIGVNDATIDTENTDN